MLHGGAEPLLPRRAAWCEFSPSFFGAAARIIPRCPMPGPAGRVQGRKFRRLRHPCAGLRGTNPILVDEGAG